MSKPKLLIATHNPGKVREYRDLLVDLPLDVTYLDAEGVGLAVEETGKTFAENAILKAKSYALATGMLTWADDSGLEVDALDGEPGVHSARYGAPAAVNDEDRYQLLLQQVRHIPESGRTARFRCVVAIATPQGQVLCTNGTCEGRIASAPRGSHGFGYDPVFLVAETHFQQTMAELSPSTKNQISHRARAARQAKKVLAELLGV